MNETHADHVAAGWTFANPFGTGPSSDGQLRQAATILNGGTFEGNNFWNEFHEGNFFWMPLPDNQQEGFNPETGYAGAWSILDPEQTGPNDREQWKTKLLLSIFLEDFQSLYVMGLIGRYTARYCQHRAVLCLANIFCLDNRGRPPAS